MNKQDSSRNMYMLKKNPLASKGYDWWWHSFTGKHQETGEEKAFLLNTSLLIPPLEETSPFFGQLRDTVNKPSYVMVKAGYWGGRQADSQLLWHK